MPNGKPGIVNATKPPELAATNSPHAGTSENIRRPSWLWTVYTWTHVVLALFVGWCLVVTAGALAIVLGDRLRRVAHACNRIGFVAIARAHPRYRLTVTGLENLPAGAAVLCPNHSSFVDVVCLFALPRHFKWLIKREFFWIPFFGVSMRLAGYLPVFRGDPVRSQRTLERGREYLSKGVSVLTFPEGTRSIDGTLGPLRSGPVRLARASNVSCVPIGIVGTAKLLPKGAWMYPWSGGVGLHIGPPIDVQAGSPREATARLRQGIEEAMAVAALRRASLSS